MSVLNNRGMADVFTLIADLSEIKGEIFYKTLAYRKAAENLAGLGRNTNEYWKESKLEEIPGRPKFREPFLITATSFQTSLVVCLSTV